jgi:hypothetical protein
MLQRNLRTEDESNSFIRGEDMVYFQEEKPS